MHESNMLSRTLKASGQADGKSLKSLRGWSTGTAGCRMHLQPPDTSVGAPRSRVLHPMPDARAVRSDSNKPGQRQTVSGSEEGSHHSIHDRGNTSLYEDVDTLQSLHVHCSVRNTRENAREDNAACVTPNSERKTV
eukprot:3323086-Rhodomonas_salina.1